MFMFGRLLRAEESSPSGSVGVRETGVEPTGRQKLRHTLTHRPGGTGRWLFRKPRQWVSVRVSGRQQIEIFPSSGNTSLSWPCQTPPKTEHQSGGSNCTATAVGAAHSQARSWFFAFENNCRTETEKLLLETGWLQHHFDRRLSMGFGAAFQGF